MYVQAFQLRHSHVVGRRRYAGVFQQNVKRIRFVLDIALAHQLVKHTREEVHLALHVFFKKKKHVFLKFHNSEQPAQFAACLQALGPISLQSIVMSCSMAVYLRTQTGSLEVSTRMRVFWRALAMRRTSFEKRLLRSSCGVNGNHLVCCSHFFEFATEAVSSSNVGKKMTP